MVKIYALTQLWGMCKDNSEVQICIWRNSVLSAERKNWKSYIKVNVDSPSQVAQLDGASSHAPKGCRFKF